MKRFNLRPFYISVLFSINLLFFFTSGLKAQSVDKDAITGLKSRGFENIRVVQLNDEVVCSVERGLNRSPSEDFKQALSVLQHVYPKGTAIHIILLEQGVPVYQLKDTGKACDSIPRLENEIQGQDIHIDYADRESLKPVGKISAVRPVSTGVTLTLYPQFTIQNIHFDKIYETQVNIAPTLSYSAWKGMLFTGQLIIPIVNDINYEGDYIRWGFLTFMQRFSLPHLNQLKFTLGNFNNHRYGFDLKWEKQFELSRWSFRANVGYTGYSNNYNMYWNHRSIDQLTWNVTGSYYLPVYQLRADLMLGEFIAGDHGFRFDLYRHFGEVTIGAYVTYTGHNPNGGFHFAIPLSPLKRKHAYRVRVMLPNYFGMEYNSRNEIVYDRYYETSPDENRSARELYPQFIQKQFLNP